MPDDAPGASLFHPTTGLKVSLRQDRTSGLREKGTVDDPTSVPDGAGGRCPRRPGGTVAACLPLAPDAFLERGVCGGCELRELAVGPERQHIRLVCGLPVRGDAGQDDHVVAAGDEVLWLRSEG